MHCLRVTPFPGFIDEHLQWLNKDKRTRQMVSEKHALIRSKTTFRVYTWAVADNDFPKTRVPLSAKVFPLHAVNAFTGVGTAIIPYFSLLVGAPMVNAHICKQNTVPWLSRSCTYLVGVYGKCTHLQTEWQTWQHSIQQTRIQIFVAKKIIQIKQ